MLIVIVLMTVSPKIIESETIVTPLAANWTGHLRISEMQSASCCEILTSNEREKRVSERAGGTEKIEFTA